MMLRRRLTEDKAAKSFAAAIRRISADELARAAGRNIETARLWKKGVRCPNTSSLFNMATVLIEVRAWALAHLGEGL